MISYARTKEHVVVLQDLQAKLLTAYDAECAKNKGVIMISNDKVVHSAFCSQLLRQMDAISAGLESLKMEINND